MGDADLVTEESSASGQYTVVLRCRSGARVRPGFYLDLFDFPDGFGEQVAVRIGTAWRTIDQDQHPLPRELWFAVKVVATDIDAAIRSATNASATLAVILSFCVNAVVEPPAMHVAFNSTAGLDRRELIENFLADESGLPRMGRWINETTFFEFGQMLYASGELPRLFRALGQYQVALRYWTTGTLLLAMTHLYIACEALTKAVQRAYEQRLGVDQNGLYTLLGVELGKSSTVTVGQGFVRREFIFHGDNDVYQAARRASDSFEHGDDDIGPVRETAQKVIHDLFEYVRSAILDLLPTLSLEASDDLMSKSPVDISPWFQQITGYIVSDRPSDPDGLGAEGVLFPMLEWSSRTTNARFEDDKLVFEPVQDVTPRFADGLRFEGRDYRAYIGMNASPPEVSEDHPSGWAGTLAKGTDTEST